VKLARSSEPSWAALALRRTFVNWEVEIARPVLVAVTSTFVLFAFSLLFSPVRRFLFSDTVPYPIYCTAEVYSLPTDHTSVRTELLLINTTDRRLSRADLERELSGESGLDGPSPDITLVYTRGIGRVTTAMADAAYNDGKGEVSVSLSGNDVVVKPKHFNPRAVIRVVIDITGWDAVEVSRAAHDVVPFRIEDYEQGCYSR
jgi:hypothetical protein